MDHKQTEVLKPLSKKERLELKKLEDRIQKADHQLRVSTLDLALAFREIKEKELWRDYNGFGAYVTERWGYGRVYGGTVGECGKCGFHTQRRGGTPTRQRAGGATDPRLRT